MGVGAKRLLVVIDRLLATLVHLRHGAAHDVLARWFGVDRSAIPRAAVSIGGCERPGWKVFGCRGTPPTRCRRR
ncbi:transposase family protein [Streptomyces sp. NPDC006459]|uniref:transposase family protein n=1 Tax=Streptomyces sp. NPDC006459 TaxID=3154303 RepID=UPI0033A8D76B